MATLFGCETEDIKRLKDSLRKIQKEEQRLRPIHELGDSIAHESVICGRALMPLYEDGKAGGLQQTFVIREFLFLFLHFVSRIALSKYGKEKHSALLVDLVDKGMRVVFVESYFKVPEDKKQEAYDGFSADFRKTNEIYWECQKVLSADIASNEDTILSRFAAIVGSAFTFASNETRVRQTIQEAAITALEKLHLDERVDAAIAILV